MTPKEKRQVEIEKLKGLSLSGKLEHMWAYHKLILTSPIILVLLIIFVHTTVQNSRIEHVLNVAVTGGFETEVEFLTELSKESLNIENRFSRILIDTNYVTRDGEFDMNSAQKFAVIVAAGGVDILISNPGIYQSHKEHRVFMDLREIFSEEELSEKSLTDSHAINITYYPIVIERLRLPYDVVYFMVLSNINIDEVNHDEMTKRELIRGFYQYVIAGM
jgi:hypothetical protein